MIPDTLTELRCSSCRCLKPVERFYRDAANTRTGRTTVCKACRGAVRCAEHRLLQDGLIAARQPRFTDARTTQEILAIPRGSGLRTPRVGD
jgi:hypothetical protein